MNPQVSKSKNNPLLSCAVTGGFEEFAGSGIILQAAAEKPVFTIGTPAISDTDNFSEVSLDRDQSTDATTTPSEPAGFYSPLSELDSMGNLQFPSTTTADQSQGTFDGNLNPISAALAQLPNAANTVFSTFSSIIKGTQEPAVIEQQVEPPAPTYGFVYSDSFDASAVPPPMFFSPSDDCLVSKTPEPVNNNAFRLGGNKKKTYAHIPGLSSSQQQPLIQNATPNVAMPPMPPQPVQEINHQIQDPIVNANHQPLFSNYQQDNQITNIEKSPEKSKFSLTSLLPSQLLEKIPSTKNLFGLNDSSNIEHSQNLNEGFSVASTVQVSESFTPQENHVDSHRYAPVNFFNSQQFVTSPFSQPNPPSAANVFSNSETLQENQSSSQFINTPMELQATHHSQNFSVPPTIDANQSSDAPCQPPPTFFNPTEASSLFKANQTNDSKPKNPYSSNRISRGVGMYKTRVQNDTVASQNFMMPPMPVPSNSYVQEPSSVPSSTNTLFCDAPPNQVPAVDQQISSSRPPSNFSQNTQNYFSHIDQHVPSMPAASFSPQQQNISSRPPSNFSTSSALENQSVSNILPTAPPSEEQSPQPKAALFSEEIQSNEENTLTQFLPHPSNTSPVPRIASPPTIEKIDPQVASLNFFQSPPETHHQPSFFSTPNPLASAQSFFESNGSEKPLIEPSTINFFNTEGTNELVVANAQSIPNFSMNQEVSPDAVDKIDQLSENIGSTLSLFATSELDATLAQKPSAAFESLIPKYLDAQEPTPVQTSNKVYRPVYRHWFYQHINWLPFAMSDSLALDEALTSEKEIVVTDGGRYEVNLKERRRLSIYWSSGTNHIRRCSWFFKNPNNMEAILIPFDEATADFLESEFEKSITNNSWNHRISIPDSADFIVMKDPNSFEYHQMGQSLVVKRGVDEFVIEDGEEAPIDHLIIAVSNFGDKVDTNSDNLRAKCVETVQNYYTEAIDCGKIGRIEVLPLSLNSIDILKMKDMYELKNENSYQDIIMKTAFYCNHEFYQKILNNLAFQLNEIVSKFRSRNPSFDGGVSLVGESFCSLFLFDLLQVQKSSPEFWKLNFTTANFYALGIPASLLPVRNNQSHFDAEFCRKFMNIINKMDPLAQRVEPLIKPEFAKLPVESIDNEGPERIDFEIEGCEYLDCEALILRLIRDIHGKKLDDNDTQCF